MFRKGSSESVQFCEEYEQAAASQKVGRVKAPAPAVRAGHSGNSPINNPGEPVLGLCSNCIHRKKCTFHRPVSGVWHCEEYE